MATSGDSGSRPMGDRNRDVTADRSVVVERAVTTDRDVTVDRSMTADRDATVADAPATGRRFESQHSDATRVDTPERSGRLRHQDAEERARQEFGGFNWGAAFFGWLVAVGIATLLTAALSAAGAAIGLTQVSPTRPARTPRRSASSAASSSWRS